PLARDYPSRVCVGRLLRQLDGRGRSVRVATHDVDFVGEACRTAVVLSHGRVRYSGPTSKAFADHSVIQAAGLEPPHVDSLARMLGLSECVSEADFLSACRR